MLLKYGLRLLQVILGGGSMDGKVYKNGMFDKCIYSLVAVDVILPSLWAMLYGIDKRSYDWPMIPIGALICSYMLYMLQKFFTYSVTLYEDHMIINNMGRLTVIKYIDIFELKEKGSACYIVDEIENEGKIYIRGTDICVENAQSTDDIAINIKDITVLQKAFIGNYDELINELFARCSKQRKAEKHKFMDKDMFVRTAAYKDKIDAKDIAGVVFLYLLLAVIILIGLFEFSAAQKGSLSPVMAVYINLIFPLFAVVSLFIIALKYIHYIKSLLKNDNETKGIPVINAVIFLVSSIIVSAAVIAAFFVILGKVKI